MKKYTENSNVRVLFLGTPEIATKPLLGLLQSGFNVVGVVTQEDKTAGRGKNEIEISPVKRLAIKAGIPVFQPHRIRKDFSFAEELEFDVIVCMAYGQIVPVEFIDLAPKKAINLHGSLLPKLRGAAPIQRAIMEGLKTTGVTLMEMVSEMDAGRIYDQKEVLINDDDNSTSMYEKLGNLAKEMIVQDLLPYVNDELNWKEQNVKDVTFAKKILPEDEHLPLDLTAIQMNRYIRGLANEPGAYIHFRGKKLKIYSSSISDIQLPSGIIKASKNVVYLGTKDKALILGDVKYEGKKKMPASAFINGARLDKNGERVD